MLRDFKTILVSKCWKCWIQGHSQLRLGVGGGEKERKTGQHRATSLWEEGLGQRASRPPGMGTQPDTKVRRGRWPGPSWEGPAGRAQGGKEAKGRPLLQPLPGEVRRQRGNCLGPPPLPGGAVVATFSPAEWQLVPLGCWLAEPGGRPQATGQRVWEDSKGLRRVRDPPWDPGPPPPPQHTHSGQGRGHLPGNPERLPSPWGGPALT